MNKQEFLTRLRKGLSGLPQEDIEERLAFYSEMIDDRMEEGLPEHEAVRAIGTVDAIITQILADTPLTKLVKEKVKPKRTLRAWEIVLLILGSPIWLSLLIAAFIVVLAAYIVVWSAVVALWSVEAAFAACALGGIVSAAIFTLQGNVLTGFAMLGIGMACAGLSIFISKEARQTKIHKQNWLDLVENEVKVHGYALKSKGFRLDVESVFPLDKKKHTAANDRALF